MIAAEQPEWLANGVLELYACIDTDVTDIVARVTGRPPISFAAFVHDYAEEFRRAMPSA